MEWSALIQALGNLEHLIDLRIKESAVESLTMKTFAISKYDVELDKLLTSSSLCTLRSLDITFCNMPYVIPNQHNPSWMNIFENLSSLSELTLRDYVQIDVVAHALIKFGDTKTMHTLRFASEIKKGMRRTHLPSIERLIDILTHLPSLHTLQLELPNPQTCPDRHYTENVAELAYSYMDNVCKILRPAFPNRTVEMFDYYAPLKLLAHSFGDRHTSDTGGIQ